MVKKANTNLYFIRRTLGPQAPAKAKIILYKAIVRSQLEYGSIIWCTISKLNLELLESVQRRATIYICRSKEIPYRDRMNISKLMPLSFRRESLDLNFAHKAREGSMGHLIQTMCTTVPP